MATTKTKTKKSDGFIEIAIIAFVLSTSAMVIAEIGGNVSNELANRQSRQTSIVGAAAPTPAATLSPEEYQRLIDNSK